MAKGAEERSAVDGILDAMFRADPIELDEQVEEAAPELLDAPARPDRARLFFVKRFRKLGG